MSYREVCQRCQRPRLTCYCAAVAPIATRTRVLILQHPRERGFAIGTAHMASLVLTGSELRVGIDFAADPVVRSAVSAVDRPAVLLFPGPGARDVRAEPPAGPVTLIVLDGTWWQAKKLLACNPALQALPRYAVAPTSPSRYRIRREPAEHCLATIEALAQVLAVLEGDPACVGGLLAPFDAMVEQQLAFARARHGQASRHAHPPRPRRPRYVPPELRLEHEKVILVYGEANAWPSADANAPAPEIVQWVACRPATGDRFEAFVAPRSALAPGFSHHTGVARERVIAGEPFDSFKARWAAFVRPGDVLASWGYYATELLRSDGVPVPPRVDLRAAASQHLGRRVGPLEACVGAFDVPVESPWAAGRAGSRIAALVAVAEGLRASRAAEVPSAVV